MDNLKGKIVLINAGKYLGKYCFIISTKNNNKNNNSMKKVVICGFKEKTVKFNQIMKKKDKEIIFNLKNKIFFKSINIDHIILTRYNVPFSWISSDIADNFENSSLSEFLLTKLNHKIDGSMKKMPLKSLILLLKKK